MAVRGEPEIVPLVEQERNLLSWKAPARPYKPQGKQQLTVPMVIAILIGIILLLAGEWMLIAVLVALVFAYWAWTTVPADMTEFSLTTRGVRLHGQLFEWGVFTRWWITEKWGHKILAFETPVNVVGRVLVPLGEVSQSKVEEIVGKFVLKEKPEDTNLDKMGKWLVDKFPLEEKI